MDAPVTKPTPTPQPDRFAAAKNLYNAMKGNNMDVPATIGDFVRKMGDSGVRKQVYDFLVKNNFDLPDYDTFSKKVMGTEYYTPQYDRAPLMNLLRNAEDAHAEKQGKQKPPASPFLISTPQQRLDHLAQQGNTVAIADLRMRQSQAAMTSATGHPFDDGMAYLSKINPKQYKRIQDMEKQGVKMTPQQQFDIEMQGIKNNRSVIENRAQLAKQSLDAQTVAIEQAKDPATKEQMIGQMAGSPELKTIQDAVVKANELDKYEQELPNKYPTIKNQIDRQRGFQSLYDSAPTTIKLGYDLFSGLKNFFVGTASSLVKSIYAGSLITGALSPSEYEKQIEQTNAIQQAATLGVQPNAIGGVVKGLGELVPNILLLASGEGAISDALIEQGVGEGTATALGRVGAIGSTTFGNYFDQAYNAGHGTTASALFGAIGSMKDIGLMSLNAPYDQVKLAMGDASGNLLRRFAESDIIDGIDDPSKFGQFQNSFKTLIKQSAEEGLNGAGQAVLFSAANDYYDKMLDGKPNKDAGDLSSLRQSILLNGLASAVIPFAVGLGSLGRSAYDTHIAQDALWDIGNHPDTYDALIGQHELQGLITPEKASALKQRVADMSAISAKVRTHDEAGRPLDDNIRKRIALNTLLKYHYQNKADAAETPELKSQYEGKIADIDNHVNHLLGIATDKPSYTFMNEPVTRDQAQQLIDEGKGDQVEVFGDTLRPTEEMAYEQQPEEPSIPKRKVEDITAEQQQYAEDTPEYRRLEIEKRYGVPEDDLISKMMDNNQLERICGGAIWRVKKT